MKWNTILILALCAMLATPALGWWEYEGSTGYITEPDGDSDPGGTWSWSQSAEGDVDFDVTSVEASGTTGAAARVTLSLTNYSGSQRSAYASAGIGGQNTYVWQDDGTSKAITLNVDITINSSNIDYEGHAVDTCRTSPCTCSSGANIQAGGGVSTIQYFYASATGMGTARTAGGTTASNSSNLETVTTDYSYFLQGPGYDQGDYEGELDGYNSTTHSYTKNNPTALSIIVSAGLNASAFAQGQWTVNDPEWWFASFNASASSNVVGSTTTSISGNIDNREG